MVNGSMITGNVAFSYVRDASEYVNQISPVQFIHPAILILIVPLSIFLFLLIKKDFVKLNAKSSDYTSAFSSRKLMKILVFVSRFLILSLILLALAEPYMELTRTTQGNPEITILVDNSTSMELYDTSFVGEMIEKLEKKIPVNIVSAGNGLDSNVGSSLLANIEDGKNILLISDGKPTRGTELNDVAMLAQSLNASISAMELENIASDVGVYIAGPSKTIAEVENEYLVKLNKIGVETVRVQIGIDDEVVYDEETSDDEIIISANFTEGQHKVVAQVYSEDHFLENNIFYKTTEVIPKPKILLISSALRTLSSLDKFLSQVYEVDYSRALPEDYETLDKYYSVIIDDISANELNSIDALSRYVINGNGLIVAGGFNSYENGGYKGSLIETILPVTIGTGEKKKGDSNIVVVVDISQSSGISYDGRQKSIDIEKALALTVIEGINEGNRVGAVAFNTEAYMVSDILPLYSNKEAVINRIARLTDKGATVLQVGMRGAFELLKGKAGSNNVIFITDGVTLDTVDLKETEKIVESMYERGIKTYVIGVGRNAKNINSDYLRNLGSLGGGFYMEASDANRLKILFGEPVLETSGGAFEVVLIDTNHFITNNLDVKPIMTGYNQVLPKSGARLLATTEAGVPALVTWRYGIGRVAALTVFSGHNNLGELLQEPDSKLTTRTVNWAIGDPQRKNDYYIDVPDTRVGKISTITVRSNMYPTSETLEFSKKDEETYTARFTPEKKGVSTILNKLYAVNYEFEYQKTGFSSELNSIVENTRGKLFKPSQIDEIVEHIKTVSKRTITEQRIITGPLMWVALIIFALEVCIRRVRSGWFTQ